VTFKRFAWGVGLVLEADDGIIRIAQDDHIACRLSLSPAIGPEVEGVVQVDVGPRFGGDNSR